ncbi:MAG: GNAT family N-acetyltransferase [Methanobacteriota archaeon]|nr:MAG: GNAT family N-acetyltransferase [Euryarchaeota archaeon]
MRIRRASLGDMPGIMRIEDLCFGRRRFSPQLVQSMLLRDDCLVLVTVDAEVVVGAAMCTFSRFQETGRIASIAVLAEHRGRGIGRSLLKASESELRDRGASRFTLEVSVDNAAAIDMYRSNGYSVGSIIADYYEKGESALYMEKDLTMRGKRTSVKVS